MPLDRDDDPLGLAARSAAPWARLHRDRDRPAFEACSKSSTESRREGSLDRHRPSNDSETYYSARSRPSSPRRSEADTAALHFLPAPYVPAADGAAVRQAQSPVPFPRMISAPRTAPAHVATFVQAERERERPPPLLRITAPSPSAGPASGSPSGGRKRRSFLPLPAIPRIAPLDFGILGHSSDRDDEKARRGTGSRWFD